MKIAASAGKSFIIKLVAVFISVFFIALLPGFSIADKGRDGKTEADKKAVMQKVLNLQMPFIENQGQIKDKSIRFYANTFAGTVFVTKDGEIIYSLSKNENEGKDKISKTHQPKDKTATPSAHNNKKETITLKESLESPKLTDIKGINKSEAKVNYFVGDKKNWKSDIATWQEVSIGEVYKGIKLKLKAHGKNVEKIFTVNPEGSVKDIKLNIEGAKGLNINKDGELEVKTELGIIKYSKPIAYQEINGKRVDIAAEYKLPELEPSTSNSLLAYSFKVGDYDNTKPLIIDPALVYSTYLGGSSYWDEGNGIAVDSAGNVYITGQTYAPDFPIVNAIQETQGMVFVTKINAAGSAIVYSTYLGGVQYGKGTSIAVDSLGNAYITGYTYSTWQGSYFPTVNAIQGSHGGGLTDAFVTKINAAGSALIYSTYLGGSGGDSGSGIAVDNVGNAYITGGTSSTDFPTVSAIQGSLAGSGGAFITKINAAGSAIVYSTYLNGAGGWDIAVDSSGNAYVAGIAFSTDFPTVNAIQGSLRGPSDAFITKINAAGSAFVYSTYLGGNRNDSGQGIAVDISGNAYITGDTYSSDFPIVNAIQGSLRGYNDAFVTKINAAGSALVYSTYLGGNRNDSGLGIAVDNSGNAYITGYTNSTDFPTISALQGVNVGTQSYWYEDAFVTKINAAGSAIVYSTYLGGNDVDYAKGIAVDSAGNTYVTGLAYSPDFPTINAMRGILSGWSDAFVTKISDVTYNTPVGSNVAVSFSFEENPQDLYVTFANVSSAGDTTATSSSTGPNPPAGFQLGEPPTYYEIGTTAVYSGLITVCITYDPAQYADPSLLSLFHYENDTWTDVTISNDLTNSEICGQTSSLSPFAIFQRTLDNAGRLIIQLITTVKSYKLDKGIENSLVTKLRQALNVYNSSKGKDKTICNILNAFTNDVSAQSGKAITATQASKLTSDAGQIKAMLGCK